MKIAITQQHPCCKLSFLDWHWPSETQPVTFYLLPSELRPLDLQTEGHRLIRDLGNYMFVEPDRLTLLDPQPPGDCRDSLASNPTPTLYVYVDTNRLFTRLAELCAKRIDTTLDTARLRFPLLDPPDLTITQMVRHPNARGDMAQTIKFFRDHLKTEQWLKLLHTISHYLSRAHVFGHRNEFYFDGRMPEGCGFNGGFILHSNEFGIHT
jgi:hypothetical protein